MKAKYILLFLLFNFSKLIGQNETNSVQVCEDCLEYWKDNDQDNWGVPPTIWRVPGLQPANYILYNGHKDCDDSDPDIQFMTFYKDSDQDGYGDPTHANTTFCTPPAGSLWVFNNLDCDDHNAAVNPNITWYVDADGDGYGSNSILTHQCTQPIGGVLNNLDCNDSNPDENINKNWYADTDGDSFGDPNSAPIVSCAAPPSYVSNNLDGCPTIYGSILGCIVPPTNTEFSGDENYIMTIKPKTGVTNIQQISNSSDVAIEIVYFDGLGREKQKISNRQSGNDKNIVTPITYDTLGRQDKEFLPYVSNIVGLEYVTNAFSPQAAYYSASSASFDATSYPYAQKLFEQSPLNRIIKQSAAGDDWKLGSGHEIEYGYQTNSLHEVRKYRLIFENGTTENHHLVANGYYAAGELIKTIVKDENWTAGLNKTVQEFKDREGRLVLKRTFDNNGDDLNTLYIYDIYGNLSYVIPPVASDAIDAFYHANQVPTARNYPWTQLADVNAELAEMYNKLFREYDNELILNEDLFRRYGGQGGFTISFDANNEPVLAITMNTVNGMSLRNGEIASLNEMGDFKDSELGRITGEGYEYIFYISKNSLMVRGKGLVNNINVTFNGNVKLAYEKNYPWSSLLDIRPEDREKYTEFYNRVENAAILTTDVENPYGAKGGISIFIDENDKVGINLTVSSERPISFRRGVVLSLSPERRIPDGEICVVEGENYKYRFGIRENNLYIEGDGSFTNIIRIAAPGGNPPIAIASVPVDILEGLCYIYHYDYRNRIVEKKIPGKGWEYLVNDKLDRVALTQDANLRLQNKWLFTKYDVYGRPVYTGQFVYNSPVGNTNILLRKELQSLSDNNTALFESRSAAPFQNGGVININYTNATFPNPGSNDTSDFTVFTVNYYDDYAFQPNGTALIIPSTSYNSSVPNDILTDVKSLTTGSIIRVLDTDEWVLTTTAYDHKSRPVWSKYENSLLQSSDVTETQLDFVGKVIETKNTHDKTGSISNLVTLNRFTYDHADRFLKQTQTIGIQPEELIVFNNYDELGKLIQKKVGGIAPPITQSYTNLTTAYQTVDYSYNIRGWLKAVNDPDTSLTDDLFAFKINYNQPQLGAMPSYNGNISETTWRSISDNNSRSYKYTYDDLNRLLQADYVGNYQLDTNPSQIENYTEGNLQYDKNGNITHLERYGLKSATMIDKIDDLQYNYEIRSNKLLQVIDSGFTAGFKDVNTVDNIDYTYDINGNMTSDVNKGITAVQYNHLNLPAKIVFYGADPDFSNKPKCVKYFYDAKGTLLEKKFINRVFLGTWLPITITTTDYANDFVYLNGILQFAKQPEGYVSNDSGALSYVYQYKDHLGNIRMSYLKNPNTGNLDVIEENNYTPFGFKHEGYNNNYLPGGNDVAQGYKFQGQERQNELGLNWDNFKFRNYDYAIGRFMCIDPLAEKYRYNSPYAFSENQVVAHRELEGLEKVYVFDQADNPNNKRVYTASVYVVAPDGTVNGPYKGSSYPSDGSKSNTVKTGTHVYNNESGHKGGTKKGLNIVDSNGERNAPGTNPKGNDVNMQYVNVHSGQPKEENPSKLENRGSEGCPTIKPSDAADFFSNFEWTNKAETTGTSTDTITIHRGNTEEAENDKQCLIETQEQQRLCREEAQQQPTTNTNGN